MPVKLIAFVFVALLAAHPARAHAQSARARPVASVADSLVLERTPCFGTCPAYRLSLTRAGIVAFESLNPGDTARRARDTIPASALHTLVAMADAIGFTALPDTIAGNRTFCPTLATDHPSVTVSIFRGAATKQVVDYLGCFAAADHGTVPVLGRLRQFELRIDSLTGSRRWVHPARRR